MIATKDDPNPSASRQSRGWRLPGLAGSLILLGLGFFALNFFVQIYRKPTEILRFARLGRAKSPRQTWNEFGADFRRYSTDVITADFLAGLVQVESSGDPFASPAWTWRWSTNLWGIYGPPSSAIGLLQITNGNFGQARYYSNKEEHFAGFHSRAIGSHSIEMTAAFLHAHVRKILSGSRRRVSLREKQKLAATIHLCGPNKGPALVRANFNSDALGICGTKPVGSYVRLVMKYRTQFAQFAAVP